MLLLDPQRTQQVINNLLSNAVKFTESGAVTVRLAAEKASDGLWDLQLDVQDTGAGMTAEQLQSIFERFAQVPGTQERYGGSGLGLTISAQLVRSAGGRIDVRSEPGQGTTFTVGSRPEKPYRPPTRPRPCADCRFCSWTTTPCAASCPPPS
jgi:signal transduction histidine kinase